MKFNITRYRFVMPLALLAVAVAIWPWQTAQGIIIVNSRQFNFASVGFVPGQEKLRISAANPANLGRGGAPDCEHVVRFIVFDTMGNRIADSGERLLPVGETLSFDFDPAGVDGRLRLQVRATVLVRIPDSGKPPDDGMPIGLEVIDKLTGKSTLLNAHPTVLGAM